MATAQGARFRHDSHLSYVATGCRKQTINLIQLAYRTPHKKGDTSVSDYSFLHKVYTPYWQYCLYILRITDRKVR